MRGRLDHRIYNMMHCGCHKRDRSSSDTFSQIDNGQSPVVRLRLENHKMQSMPLGHFDFFLFKFDALNRHNWSPWTNIAMFCWFYYATRLVLYALEWANMCVKTNEECLKRLYRTRHMSLSIFIDVLWSAFNICTKRYHKIARIETHDLNGEARSLNGWILVGFVYMLC